MWEGKQRQTDTLALPYGKLCKAIGVSPHEPDCHWLVMKAARAEADPSLWGVEVGVRGQPGGGAWMCKHCWSGPVACHSPCTAAWPPTLSGLCTMGGPVLNCMSSHSPTPLHSSQHRKGQKESKHPGRALLLYCTEPGKSHGLSQPSNECVPRFYHLMSYPAMFPVGFDSKVQALTDNLPQQTRKAIMQSH